MLQGSMCISLDIARQRSCRVQGVEHGRAMRKPKVTLVKLASGSLSTLGSMSH